MSLMLSSCVKVKVSIHTQKSLLLIGRNHVQVITLALSVKIAVNTSEVAPYQNW